MSAIATHPNETDSLFAELDYRDSNGIEVWLLSNRDADALTIYVCDSRAGESFELVVHPEQASQILLHPFCLPLRKRSTEAVMASEPGKPSR